MWTASVVSWARSQKKSRPLQSRCKKCRSMLAACELFSLSSSCTTIHWVNVWRGSELLRTWIDTENHAQTLQFVDTFHAATDDASASLEWCNYFPSTPHNISHTARSHLSSLRCPLGRKWSWSFKLKSSSTSQHQTLAKCHRLVFEFKFPFPRQ